MDNDRKLCYIVEHYAKLMHSSANSVLKDYYEAEDACQESFIKLYRVLDRIENVESRDARAYCITTARNTALDIARRKKHQIPVEVVYADPESAMSLDWYPYESDALIGEIGGLPEIYRSIIEKRCIEQKSASQTAKELNTKVSTVNSRLKRARDILKKKLACAKDVMMTAPVDVLESSAALY